MDKETKALIDFYDNQIKDLKSQKNQALNDCDLLQHKLDKIEKYIKGHQIFGRRYGKTLYADSLNNILQIIKGEDK